VLAPLLFALAIDPVLRAFAEAFPELELLAYLDDLCVAAADPQTMQEAVTWLENKLGEIGLSLNASKSFAVSCHVDDEWQLSVSGVDIPDASNECARILGSGFSPRHPELLSPWLRLRAETPFFTTLQALPLSLSARMVLLRMCGLPRMTFLCRTHEPGDLTEATKYFDGEVLAAVTCALGRAPDHRARALLQLPTRLGGLGLRPTELTASVGLACVGNKGEQQRSLRAVEAQRYSALFDTLSGLEQTLVLSHAHPVASRPLTDSAMRLPDEAMRQYVLQRLLLRILPIGATCPCGADASNDHVLSCGRLGSNPKLARHEAIADALQLGCSMLGFIVHREPRAFAVLNAARPDVYLVSDDRLAATDVTVTFAAHRGVVGARQLAAASAAVATKTAQWQRWASTMAIDFAPFVLEHSGAMPKVSIAWLRRVVGDRDHDLTVASAFDDIMRGVLVALHRCNVQPFACAVRG
jgi:hypothetical protein